MLSDAKRFERYLKDGSVVNHKVRYIKIRYNSRIQLLTSVSQSSLIHIIKSLIYMSDSEFNILYSRVVAYFNVPLLKNQNNRDNEVCPLVRWLITLVLVMHWLK